MPLKFPGPLMRMTYVEYKMHNVLLNNSQPIIGPNARRCVSLMDLCFLRTGRDPRPYLASANFASASARDNGHRSTRRESEIIKTNETVRDDERVAFADDPDLLSRVLAQKLPNYKTHSVNRRVERGRHPFGRA